MEREIVTHDLSLKTLKSYPLHHKRLFVVNAWSICYFIIKKIKFFESFWKSGWTLVHPMSRLVNKQNFFRKIILMRNWLFFQFFIRGWRWTFYLSIIEFYCRANHSRLRYSHRFQNSIRAQPKNMPQPNNVEKAIRLLQEIQVLKWPVQAKNL